MGEDRRHPGNEDVIAAVTVHMDRHIDEFHAFKKPELQQMVIEHKAIIDTLHGEKHPTAADPDSRNGGMAEKVDRIEAIVTNGGVKAKLPPAFYTTVVTSATAIVVAIIYALGQTHP